MYISAQIVGVFAVATFLLSYQFRKRKHIILVNSISSVLYVLQYVLLGAFEGAAIDILSAISSVAAHNKDRKWIAKYMKILVVVLNLAILGAGLSFYKNIFSLFPVVGAILQTSAFWITSEKKSGKSLSWVRLFGSFIISYPRHTDLLLVVC